MNIRLLFIILINCSILFSFDRTVFANETSVVIADTIVGIKLGTTVAELLAKFPGIYKNKLDEYVTLYETCNQGPLEVFSFTEESWSKGHITNIWVRKDKVDVCRDSTGSLPDFAIMAITPRGIRLGDKEEQVLKLYGKPTIIKYFQGGKKILSYKETERKGALVKNLALHFTIINGYVTSFHLFGDMPWAKKPE